MIYYETELYHHGVKGMKWGVRRYQNKDGSYTATGKKRYGLDSGSYGNKRAARFARKIGEEIERNDKDMSKIYDARVENRAKLEGKYDKKIDRLKEKRDRNLGSEEKVNKYNEKIKNRQTVKKDNLREFDKEAKYVKAGFDWYNNVLSNYRDAKVKAFEDKVFKKSPEYKNAIYTYVGQKMSDIYLGSKYVTVATYARNARDYDSGRKKKY